MAKNERGAGRKRKYNAPAKVKGFLVRLDYENEMTEEINQVQEKYKKLPLKTI